MNPVAPQRHQTDRDGARRVITACAEDRYAAAAVWTERRADAGEDADPLLLHHRPTGSGLLAVFDGSGGSGSGAAWNDPRGVPRSGAWVGARLARSGVEEWFTTTTTPLTTDSRADAAGLAGRLRELLRSALPPTRSKVTGTMRRRLPTTMAGLAYWPTTRGGYRCRALWAGDSRVYVLSPWSGLQPVSRDHTVETDALAQLEQDPPMTNVISADQAFTIGTHEVDVLPGCVLIAATDGFFGYLKTPADFELILLDTLVGADDLLSWADRLARCVESYTADDASLALVVPGHDDFGRLRHAFEPRLSALRAQRGSDPPPHDGDLRREREWRETVWKRYRDEYERLMPAAEGEST